MEIVFVNDCAVDGCYKKRKKPSAFCKEHKAKLEAGEILTAFYGKRVKKTEEAKAS